MGSISFEVLGGKTGIKIVFKSNGTKGFKMAGESTLSFGKATQENIEEYLVRLWTQFGNDVVKSIGGDQSMQTLFHNTFFKSWQSENTKLWRNLFMSIFNLEPEERVRYRKEFKYDITLKENLALTVDMPEDGSGKPEERRKEPRTRISGERRDLGKSISKIQDGADMQELENVISKLSADRSEKLRDLKRTIINKTKTSDEVLLKEKKELTLWVQGEENRENPNRFTDEEVTELLRKWNR